MEVTHLGNALRSQTRVNILKILGRKSLRAIDVYREYKTLFSDDAKHREFIYKELELLVDAGLLDKRYDRNTKSIIYTLRFQKISIDLIAGEVTAE